MPAPTEEQFLRSLERSKAWRYIVGYLTDRREKLYHIDATDTFTAARKEGAVGEINKLLRLPHLVLDWYSQQRAAEASATALDPSLVPGEDTDDSPPRGRAFTDDL